MKNLTCCEKAYICGLRDGGMSVGDIEQKTGVTASGIYKVLKRESGDQPPSSANPVGRPEKHSARDKRAYLISVKRGTTDKITQPGTTEMSKYAMRKVLQQANLDKNNNKVTKKKTKATNRRSK